MSKFIGTVTDYSYYESCKEQRDQQQLNLHELLDKYWRVKRRCDGEVGATMLVAHYQQKRFYKNDPPMRVI